MQIATGRQYYSFRNGLHKGEAIDLEVLKRLFAIAFKQLRSEGYFQEYLGIDCEDGYITGKLGDDIETVMFIRLRKNNLYPILENLPSYTEDDLFDVIEFLHDHCTKGIDGNYHSWNGCGHHYNTFDGPAGCAFYRSIFNPLLADYKNGYEVSEKGEILILADEGLSTLINADIPSNDSENVRDRINAAILKFRRRGSSFDERRDAVRELADVLEYLRPQVKECLDGPDERDLFNIANNFGVRHHNASQKTNYDKAIWYSWIFYFYLSTIHAVLRMIEKKNSRSA